MRLSSLRRDGAWTIAVLVLLGASTTATADPIVVPGATAATEGVGNNSSPFDLPHPFPLAYQQVYGAEEFGSVPLWINGMAFRPDAEAGHAFSNTVGAFIYLSTTTASPDGLSEILNNNLGLDNTLVIAGSLALASHDTGPADGPKDFDIRVTFTNRFFYDPTRGNLLLYVVSAGGAQTTPFDAVVALDSVSRAWSTGAGTPTGRDTLGLVTQFDATPVPEPASLTLLGVGLAGLAARRRRRRKES